ncbi:SDH family Clp fold serine proteinase [Mycolicibacterium sp. Dal123E01]|uniref:SDH family Clp fold serine proteinase n=1 Tax=Mycolicibacterium sp. Dal123E01 TaxID=3457578 RepID=UPI00403E4DF6
MSHTHDDASFDDDTRARQPDQDDPTPTVQTPAVPDSSTPPPTPTPTVTPPTSTTGDSSPQPRRTPLFEAMNTARYGRQSLIREIEASTGNALLCMVSEHGQIHRGVTTAGIVDLLHNVSDGKPIDLLLNSPGGDIDTAEKIITLIRKRAEAAPVRVIVPDYAKSAATLIALGANQVVMSHTSELGPIDPQVELTGINGVKTIHSAQNYVDSYGKHAKKLRKHPDDPVARLMLDMLDPVVLKKLKRTIKRSNVIASALLQTAMIKDPEKAAEAAKQLADTNQWHSHGQMIGHEQCTKIGLEVSYQNPKSDVWERIWRLYCLQLAGLQQDHHTLFESNIASLSL